MHNALRSSGLRPFVTTATTGSVGFLFVLLLSSIAQAGPAEVDDGWRRTRFGWENIKHWNLSPEQRELPVAAPIAITELLPAAKSSPVLFHPLVVALGLSLVAVAALRTATPREQVCAN